MKVVQALSGGLDSETVLAHLLNHGYEVHCLNFTYGSKHNQYECAAAKKIAEYYNVPYTLIDMTNIFQHFKSNLLKSGGEIPEGHYNDENMSLTVVPGRNTIFASTLMGYAESIDANAIALGVHLGDHHIYADCRKEYVKALDTLIYLATDKKIEVIAPFINTDKTGIVKRGLELKVPYELSRTCYKNQEKACGKCVAENTLILMSNFENKPIREIEIGDEIIGIGKHHEIVKAKVLNKIDQGIKETIVIENDSAAKLILTDDHECLTVSDEYEKIRNILKSEIPFLINYNLAKTKIKYISKSENRVYDITTSTGNFIANGMIVHNCGSCTERLEAFKLNNAIDPIEYSI